jgi:hypothetical protein
MFPSRFDCVLLAFVLISSLLLHSPSALGSKRKVEISGLYNSFAPNVGGLSSQGGRIRLEHAEFTILELDGSLTLESALAKKFQISSAVIPRFIFGAAVGSGTLNLVAGVGFTFPLFGLFGGQFGVSLDNYIFAPILYRGRIGVIPVIPFSLTFLF